MSYFRVFPFVLALAGCTSPMGSLGSSASGSVGLDLLPKFQQGDFQTQAVLTPYASSSVDHLVVSLYRRDALNAETAVTSGNLPVEKDVASDSFTVPLSFVGLHHNTNYRIRAKAYRAAGRNEADVISSTAASYLDVNVLTDDKLPLATLPIQLADQFFSGQASSSVDFTPGQLVHAGTETIALQGAPTPAPRPIGTLRNFVAYDTLPYVLERTAPLQVGNKLYLFGGTTSTGETNKILVTTIGDTGLLGTFAEVSGNTLVTARSGHYATVVGSYVYVIGGIIANESTPLASVERATINGDGSLGAFATVGACALNTARGLFTGFNSGTYVYAIGGKTPYFASVERAKINANGTLAAFTTEPLTLNMARMSAGGVRVGRYFYVVGGEGPNVNPQQLNTIERSTVNNDGSLGAFTVDGKTLSSNRNRMGSVVLADKIYFFGGFNGGFLSAIDSATINSDDTFGTFAISATSQLATGLENGVTFMTSNAVYYIGGYNYSLMNTVQRAPIQ